MNVVTLVGRIATDVTLRYTPNGKPVAQFRLAVDRPSRDKENRKADFIPIVTWGNAAEAAARYLQKGRLVAVRGRLQVRQYEVDGQRRSISEVVGLVSFLPDGRRNGSNGNGNGHTEEAAPADAPVADEMLEAVAAEDEDVPF